VTRARVQLSESAGRLILATTQLERNRIDLARALGLDSATPLELTDTLTADLGAADVPIDRDAAVSQGVDTRPDLAAEVARGAAARTAAKAISAERLPRLDITADAGLSGTGPDSVLATNGVSLQITLPILDGFRREGRLAEQRAVARESDVRARDLRLQVAADVDGALLDLRSASAQQMIARERLQLAAQEVSQARQRFQAGVAGNIEVINAQESLVRASRCRCAVRRAGGANFIGSLRWRSPDAPLVTLRESMSTWLPRWNPRPKRLLFLAAAPRLRRERHLRPGGPRALASWCSGS
jgi:outer membrane protein TolC